jgi:hypothetical protein
MSNETACETTFGQNVPDPATHPYHRLAAAADELRALRQKASVAGASDVTGRHLFFAGQWDAFNTAIMIVAHPDEYRAAQS